MPSEVAGALGEAMARIAELEAALRPFATMADQFDTSTPEARDDLPLTVNRGAVVTLADMRRARDVIRKS